MVLFPFFFLAKTKSNRKFLPEHFSLMSTYSRTPLSCLSAPHSTTLLPLINFACTDIYVYYFVVCKSARVCVVPCKNLVFIKGNK